MPDPRTIRSDFWTDVSGLVTARVRPMLRAKPAARQSTIAYLRDLERLARTQSDGREAVQVIASGRRLLGDRQSVGPLDGPFSRT